MARVWDRWILCLGRPPPYEPEVGKRCSGLMPIVCPIRRQRRSITMICIAGRTACGPAMSSLSRPLFPTHGWVRGHRLGHHDAGLDRQPSTHRERAPRPAPSRRTDTRQDHPHCLTTQHSRGHTCPRRTALAVSLSATDLDQLRWTAEARMPVGLRDFASSESLPGVCRDPQRQGALDAEHCVGPYETRPLPRRPGSPAYAPRLRQRSRPTGATGRSDVIR